MRTTIDKAGRLVLPKELRDQVGLRSGPVEVVIDGAALRVEPITSPTVVERRDGRLVVAASAEGALDDATVRLLRDALQR